MRKYAIELLISGSMAVLFSLLLLLLACVHAVTTIEVLICLIGITGSFTISFHALSRLASNGHLMTDICTLLKMRV